MQEWKNHLRSAIHPVIFAAVYQCASCLAWVLRLSPTYRADLLVAAPKVVQAVFAAVGDYYTWKLGERIYGNGSNEAWAAVCGAYDLSTHRNDSSSISLTSTACSYSLQSVAVVLFNAYIVQLP